MSIARLSPLTQWMARRYAWDVDPHRSPRAREEAAARDAEAEMIAAKGPETMNEDDPRDSDPHYYTQDMEREMLARERDAEARERDESYKKDR